MFKKVIKILSIGLLLSITFSLPILKGQEQPLNRAGSSEITFLGKEGARWTEKREPPLPIMMGQGVKEEPQLESIDLREDAIGPMRKMSPSTTVPGCGYSNRFARGIVTTVGGDHALYEQGRYQYFEGKYEDALTSFRKLTNDHPNSPLVPVATYWMGETLFHQGRVEEAYPYFRKVALEYPGSEYYEYSLYSCGWIQLQQENYEDAHRWFYQVYEKNPTHPIAESSLFWSGYCLYALGRYRETLQEMEAGG